MKIKIVLLNLLPIVFSFVHTLLAKFDIVGHNTTAYLAVILIGMSPLAYSIINYRLSNTIMNLVVLNVIFIASQLVGFIVYDIVMVGSISDTYGILSIPTIFYVLILTVVSVLIKVITRSKK